MLLAVSGIVLVQHRAHRRRFLELDLAADARHAAAADPDGAFGVGVGVGKSWATWTKSDQVSNKGRSRSKSVAGS